MDQDQLDEVDKLYHKFENEAHDRIKADSENGRLHESGQPRNFLKNLVSGIVKYAEKRLDVEHQVKLYLLFAADFFELGEFGMALETYQRVLDRCDAFPDGVATRTRVDAMQNVVRANYGELVQLKSAHIAPMVVSKLLLCLQQLRHSLEAIFDLPTRQQEGLAWLVLNSCKLIMEIGQPLLWHSCGKYVTETMLFGALSLEAVINLCTVRHMKFRMKMYASVFYAALAQGSTEEAVRVLGHASRQAAELRERELLDPPVPRASTLCLQQCTLDLAVMQFTADFWRDPEAFDLSQARLGALYSAPAPDELLLQPSSLADLCASECTRVHLLTSGNANEPYKKRSSCILRGLVKELSTFVPTDPPTASEGESLEPSEPDAAQLALYDKFTLRALLEGMVLALFGAADVDVGTAVQSLGGLARDKAAHERRRGAVDEEAAEQIELLMQLRKITHGGGRVGEVARLVSRFEALSYADRAYRVRALLRQAAVELWRGFLYPALQTALSDLQTGNGDEGESGGGEGSGEEKGEMEGAEGARGGTSMGELAPALQCVVQVLDLCGLQDPVLLGALALLAAQVQWALGEHRACISLLQQAIHTVDEARTLRVDALSHMPEDVRDVLALQRASFTTRGDSQDWYNSLKRLGAHAFAGFGIFGLASSGDRGDQALAEVHADLCALHFRAELAYCAQQSNSRAHIRGVLNREEKHKRMHADALLQGIKLKPDKKSTKPGTALTLPGTAGTRMGLATQGGMGGRERAEVNAEALSVVPALRGYCSKNLYKRALLLMEMGNLDSDPTRRAEYLQDAFAALEEAEGREQVLKESFADLLVMTDRNRKAPIVIARSSRYIYIAPVGCRRLKAQYYRVLGKERGSGTEVCLHNDDLAGCEQRVLVSDLVNLRRSVVRVGPLRPGEQYMFACAGFAEDRVVGGMSPSTPIIEAVNPLPTLLLWNWLQQAAGACEGMASLSREAAQRVSARFFLKTPSPSSRVVGRGVNFFLFREPSLCMLALHQSSPLLVESFVQAALAFEGLAHTQTHSTHEHGIAVNWTKDSGTQLAALASLQRTALVATVACGVGHCGLTLRCVTLGYEAALQLARVYLVHLAPYIQSALTVLVLALQSTAKRNWGLLEHKLYCRLLAHAAKVAAINCNVAPLLPLLNGFFPEALDKADPKADKSRPKAALMPEYVALLGVVQQCVAETHLAQFNLQMAGLFTPLTVEEHSQEVAKSQEQESPEVSFLWAMQPMQRRLLLQNAAASLCNAPDTPERVQMDTWVHEAPQCMSQQIEATVQLVRQLKSQADVASLLDRLPLASDLLAPQVREIASSWGCKILSTLAELAQRKVVQVSPRTAAAAAKGKKGPEPTPEEVEALAQQALKVPERFLDVEEGEGGAQMRALGELCLVVAKACLPGGNHYPASAEGPSMHIDPNTFRLGKPTPEEVAVEGVEGGAVEGVPPLPTTLVAPLSAASIVQLLGASADLLLAGGAPSAATQALCCLWNFIVSQWTDPAHFAEGGGASPCLQLLEASAELLEGLSFVAIPDTLDDESEGVGSPRSVGAGSPGDSGSELGDLSVEVVTESSPSYQRETKENLLLLRALMVFLVKAEWIRAQNFLELVHVSSRIFKVLLMNSPEFLKAYAVPCLPLIVNSQEALIDQAAALHHRRELELENFVLAWEEAQKKKRKKKLRIARLEKDDDELLYDAERAMYALRVGEADAALTVTREDMQQIRLQQTRLDRACSAGSRALDRVRAAAQSFLEECTACVKTAAMGMGGGEPDRALVLASQPELSERLAALLGSFKPVVSHLREKKEKVLLVEALKLQGDLLLYFGRINEARAVWSDAVDGLFNVMDACTHWREVAGDAVAGLELALVPGILPAVCALSKLTRYCASQDWDAKAGYCRMAAELCRIPFQGSLGHPSSAVGFAAYNCIELGGVMGLTLRQEALSAADLCAGLLEVLNVLLQEGQFVASLPAACLLEHLHAVYVRSPALWLSARLLRLRALIGAHLLAEAASLLASLQPCLTSIREQRFSDALREGYSRSNASLEQYDTSASGLCFHGRAPYLNNLPPDEARNTAALQWISQYPGEFEQFSKGFTVLLPVPVRTPEELAALAERKAREAEEAEAAKKSKGKGKGKVEEVVVVEESLTRPLFSVQQTAELHVTVADFLISVACTDTRSTTPSAPALRELGTKGLAALASASDVLFRALPPATAPDAAMVAAEEAALANAVAAPEPAAAAETAREGRRLAQAGQDATSVKLVRSAGWLRLFARIQLLRNASDMHRREYKRVRARCVRVLKFLSGPAFCPPQAGAGADTGAGAMCGDIRGVLSMTWLALKADLAEVADRQARFAESKSLCTQAAREAAMQLAGHWLRAYLLQRARANFKLGELPQALSDCLSCVQQFAANQLEDATLVRVLFLQATVLREMALHSPQQPAAQAFLEALGVARKAAGVAEQLAQRAGAFPADSNVTYGRSDTAARRHHMITPVLQSLTSLHENEPALSLQPRFDRRRLAQMGVSIPSLGKGKGAGAGAGAGTGVGAGVTSSMQGLGISTLTTAPAAPTPSAERFGLPTMRLAPVDATEGVLAESEFANVYLSENLLLLRCWAAQCQLLDDARNAGLEQNALFLQHYEPDALECEQLALGEGALKLTRHCLFLPIDLRVSVLVRVGSARIAKKSKFTDPDSYLQTLVGPLTAALQVTASSQAAHLWSLLRLSLAQLVELYGDNDVPLGVEGPARLGTAVRYLLAAIKASNARAALIGGAITLAADASFSGTPSAELLRLTVNLSCSSATAITTGKVEAAKVEEKGKKGKAPQEVGKLEPNGRDALYLLCSLLRESDPLWGGEEQALCADMHSMLAAAYPVYAAQCGAPESESEAVRPGAASTLWVPTHAPAAWADVLERQPNSLDYKVSGLYSHLHVFFLLGDRVSGDTPAAADATSLQPFLTKLTLPRLDVVFIEKALRDTRDRLIDAAHKHKALTEKAPAGAGPTRAEAAELARLLQLNRLCADEAGDTLVLLLSLLRGGVISEQKASADPGAAVAEQEPYTVAESQTDTLPLHTLTLFLGPGTLALKVTPTLLLNLAQVLSADCDTLQLPDNDVCSLLRLVLNK